MHFRFYLGCLELFRITMQSWEEYNQSLEILIQPYHKIFFNPSDAKAIFIQSTRMQRFLKTI